MPVISQNLTIPQGLVDGQIAHASHVIPLYNALNAFNIPSTVGVFQIAFADDNLTTLNLASTVTKDYAITAVPQLKSFVYYIPFRWITLGSASLNITFRINATGVTAASANFASAVNGNGLLWGYVGAHDTDTPRSFNCQISQDNTVGITMCLPNADLPAASITSVGLTVAGAATGTVNVKHVRFWAEG